MSPTELENDEKSGEPGTHVRVVMELLGHSQLSETLKRYTKVREGLKRQALDRLDTLLRSVDAPEVDDQLTTNPSANCCQMGCHSPPGSGFARTI